MVITIDGIHKLKGHIFCNRTIESVTSEDHFNNPVYVFHFPPINGGGYLKWENDFRIFLYREPKNGTYEMYWMGLHSVTCQRLDISEIRNFQTFYSYLEKVVRLGKQYWDENTK